jgi:hypothetical protein
MQVKWPTLVVRLTLAPLSTSSLTVVMSLTCTAICTSVVPSYQSMRGNRFEKILSHHIPSHHIPSHHIPSHHIPSIHIRSHHIPSIHITSRHITSHHNVCRPIPLHHNVCRLISSPSYMLHGYDSLTVLAMSMFAPLSISRVIMSSHPFSIAT